jgi:phage shock protein A
VASAAEAAARVSAAPGDLEDLSGDSLGFGDLDSEPIGPDLSEIIRLRRELGVRMDRLQRTIADAQKRSRDWQKKHEAAKKQGAKDLARESERNADLERARMHSALAEMAQIEQEIKRLGEAEKAAAKAPPRRPRPKPGGARPRGSGTSAYAPQPSVDDLLEQMKRGAGAPPPSGSKKRKSKKKKRTAAVDDELEALKRKMAARKGRKP